VVFIIAFGATYILCSIKEVIFSLSDDHICSMALIPALNYFDLFLDFFLKVSGKGIYSTRTVLA